MTSSISTPACGEGGTGGRGRGSQKGTEAAEHWLRRRLGSPEPPSPSCPALGRLAGTGPSTIVETEPGAQTRGAQGVLGSSLAWPQPRGPPLGRSHTPPLVREGGSRPPTLLRSGSEDPSAWAPVGYRVWARCWGQPAEPTAVST